MKKYRVIGNFEGKRVNEVVSANSKRQAKIKAGFITGNGGYKIKLFMRCRSIKVVNK